MVRSYLKCVWICLMWACVALTAAAPTVTSFSPTSGGIGTSVTLTGTNFTGATAVKFHGTAASSFSVTNSTTISAVVASGTTTGTITVTTLGGTATSSTSFTFVPAPTITNFSPTSGGVGTSVGLTGTNYTGAAAVKFNGTAASSYTVNNSTSITAIVASGTTTGTITVTTSGGTGTSSSSFTFVAAPTITSFSPTSGGIGASVTLTGTNFTGATAVKFNGTASTSFSVTNSTTIAATVPTGATSGTISVTTPGGTATSSLSFTVVPAPTIISFSPTTGGAGTSVGLTGTNFTGATAVKFHGTAASSFTVNSATSITAVTPNGATTGTITVTTPGGTATSSSNFTAISAPTITSFSPSSGAVGITVTLTGTNFTGATAVKFNGVDATSYSVVSSISLSAVVPLGVTTGSISVTTPGGTVASSTSFTAIAVTISPASATVALGANKTFTATVTGSTTRTVTWATTGGSITSGGIYTAPNLVGTYSVTATSVADPTKSASSVVTVPISVAVFPSPITMDQGSVHYFGATVSGTDNQNVIWTASSGTIDSDGRFTAPSIAGTVTLTATSQADQTASGTARVTVRSVAVTLSPSTLSLPSGETYGFSATVTGSVVTDVLWTVISGGGYFASPQYGSGNYVSPFATGSAVIKATSVADSTKSATATITLTANPNPIIHWFTVTPPRVEAGGSVTLQAEFGNGLGVIQPGSIGISSGQQVPVTPGGSTAYVLTVTASSGDSVTETVQALVTGPGIFNEGPTFNGIDGSPSPLLDRDGQITVVMGTVGDHAGALAERFDPGTGQVNNLGYVFPDARDRYASVLMPDGRILVFGGTSKSNNNNIWHTDYVLFDPRNGAVANGWGPSAGLLDLTLTLLNDGSVLFAGGLSFDGTSYGQPSQVLSRWSEDRTFNAMPQMAETRAGHQALLLMDGRVLLAGGNDPALLEVYDPVANTCKAVGTGPLGAVPVLRPDGKVLLLTPLGDPAAIWDPVVNAVIQTLTNPCTGNMFQTDMPTYLPDGLILTGGVSQWAPLLDPGFMQLRSPQSQVTSDYYDNGTPMVLLPDGRVFQLSGYFHGFSTLFDAQPTFTVNPATTMTNAGLRVSFQTSGAGGMVTWSASGGTITTDGQFTTSQAGLYSVTAQAATGEMAVAWVRVFQPVTVTITRGALPPGAPWLRPGDTVPMLAKVANTPNKNIIWSLAPGTTGATLTSDGQFSATIAGTYTVVATPAADPTRAGSFPLTVFSPGLQPPTISSLNITPTTLQGFVSHRLACVN